MKRRASILLALMYICLIAIGCANNVANVGVMNVSPTESGNNTEIQKTTIVPVPTLTAESPTDNLSTIAPVTEMPTPYSSDTPITSQPTKRPDTNRTQEPNSNEEPKVVYLTFDDGPSARNTEDLLDILDRYNIKATFFTVGYFVERHPELVREAMQRGHLIGCHTYSHEFNEIYASSEAFMEEIHHWEEAVENATGVFPSWKIMRFPGGTNNVYLSDDIRAGIMDSLNEEGYRYYDWFFGDNDRWPSGNTKNLPFKEYLMESFETSMRNAISAKRPLIFLAHDTCEESVEMLPQMLDRLIEEGYTFKTLEDFEGSAYFNN